MIKKFAKNSIAVALLASLGVAAGMAQAQERVYVIDQRGEVATSGTGLCWRTGYWTPAAAANDPAGCQCDKDLLPKEKCDAAGAKGAASGVKPSGDKITLAADALFDFDKAVLRPEGKGETQPVTGDKCKNMGAENGRNKKLVECLQADRRVDIELIGTK